MTSINKLVELINEQDSVNIPAGQKPQNQGKGQKKKTGCDC